MVTGISKFFLLAKEMINHPIVVRSLEIIVRDLGDHLALRTGEGKKVGQYQLPVPGSCTC